MFLCAGLDRLGSSKMSRAADACKLDAAHTSMKIDFIMHVRQKMTILPHNVEPRVELD